MKTNAYTMAIDHIHVSESAIEAALAAAKLRASKTASSQAKARYAAIAASVVLAGAASAVYFGNIVKFEPPVSPSPIVPTVTATQAEQPTASKASAATEKHTQATEKAQATQNSEAPISYSETSSTTETTATDRQEPKPTDAPVTPTVAPTQSAPDQPTTEPNPLPEVDSSQLCADGKLFIALAPTGLSQIDDPGAFSDDHLYYIETKFGRYYKIQPPKLDPPVLSWIDQPKSDQMVYLYNSDGEIVGEAPVWW